MEQLESECSSHFHTKAEPVTVMVSITYSVLLQDAVLQLVAHVPSSSVVVVGLESSFSFAQLKRTRESIIIEIKCFILSYMAND